MLKKLISSIALLLSLTVSNSQAEEKYIKTFNPGSYQQILHENAGQPFVLAIWSVDCPSCIRDMNVLSQIRQAHPELKIVMLSTDEPDATQEVKTILARNNLSDLDNWLFGNQDAQKLRFEIDPSWYGELPRTYFFTSSHYRTGKSGALKMGDFEAQIGIIKP